MTKDRRKEYKSLYWEMSEVLDMLETIMHRVMFNNAYSNKLTYDELEKCHLNLNKKLSRMRSFIVKAEDNSNE